MAAASKLGTPKPSRATASTSRGIAFGAHTTLAYAENNTADTLTVTDGRHAASIALLRNYMAGSFVTVADGYGGTLISEVPPNEQLPLGRPRG